MPYSSPATVSDGTTAPASWGNSVKAALDFLANPPSCRVRRTTAQSIPHSTDTVVSFDAARWNTNSFWVIGSPTRVTINTAGVYIMSFTGELPPFNDYTRGFAYIRVNGATIVAVGPTSMTTNNVSGFEISVAGQWKFAAADYFEVFVAHSNTAAAARNLQSSGSYSPEITATWIGLG